MQPDCALEQQKTLGASPFGYQFNHIHVNACQCESDGKSYSLQRRLAPWLCIIVSHHVSIIKAQPRAFGRG